MSAYATFRVRFPDAKGWILRVYYQQVTRLAVG